MNCPNCNKANSTDATKCECGYAFKGYQEDVPSGVTGVTSKKYPNYNLDNQNVTVTNIKMEFFAMVEFMVKWAIASIPAFIILVLIGAAVGFVLMAMLGIGGLALN